MCRCVQSARRPAVPPDVRKGSSGKTRGKEGECESVTEFPALTGRATLAPQKVSRLPSPGTSQEATVRQPAGREPSEGMDGMGWRGRRAGGRWKQHAAHRASETLGRPLQALSVAPKFCSAAAFVARSTLHARARPGTLLAEPLVIERGDRMDATWPHRPARPALGLGGRRPESSDTGGLAPYRPATSTWPWALRGDVGFPTFDNAHGDHWRRARGEGRGHAASVRFS
jgi:hypothetical protein